jgi:ariadne-1
MWKAWLDKTTGESETRNWIQANTKPCPKCSKPVEKNGGCNHIVCPCGQPMCWLCGQGTGRGHSATSIEGHSCGRFREDAEAVAGSADFLHKRYMHFFQRWKGHQASVVREGARMKKIATDERWMTRATEILGEARSVLAPTYPFSYVFFHDPRFTSEFSGEGRNSPAQHETLKKLFEDQQEALEKEVERLSGLVDAIQLGISQTRYHNPVPVLMIDVINSTVSIQDRIVRLYDLVEAEMTGRFLTSPTRITPYRPSVPSVSSVPSVPSVSSVPSVPSVSSVPSVIQGDPGVIQGDPR